jgi:hypothetical protein
MDFQVFDPSKHNLDCMHIEKNVCEHLLRILSGKKDTAAVRKDMQERGIRPALWLLQDERRRNQWLKFQAPYSCTKAEWATILDRLERIRFPTGYAGAMKKHIRKGKLGSLKSHDYHVLMQQVLPVCLQGLMQAPVRSAIMRLSRVFRVLYGKVWDPTLYKQFRLFTVKVLCDLELLFPPAFFQIMTHLILHLVDEVQQFGPLGARTCYSQERFIRY